MLACEGVVYSTEEAMCTVLYETTLPHCRVTFRTADFGITNKAAKNSTKRLTHTLQLARAARRGKCFALGEIEARGKCFRGYTTGPRR